ncbi:MAG: alpha-hydroxy-acid oxidizing protein [Deltaproteobacteria bacterium]|nr:alpha-hydroxy-acid oxidizing protein [Deltaproteobacteria bacterium]
MTADLLNIFEYEQRARDTLAAPAFDYYASGAHDGLALRDNRAAYDRLRLAYRVLVDVSKRSAATTVLGTPVSMPVVISPTAFHGMAHADAELATARAASDAGTIMILSSLSNTAVEDVVAAAAGPVWFQLYVYRDREATAGLVRRVEAAGCEAIVLTVDAPRLGRREADVRNRFHLPEGLSVRNMLPDGYGDVSQQAAESGLAAYFESLIDPSLSWSDIAWLQSLTTLPLIIKGIVRADDARQAVDAGVAGIVVSNHGGRQLDTSIATIDALPAVADAVQGRLEILLDGGVRRGTDVLKAVALGAQAVGVGRPILWGLAADGQAGVARVLSILREELDLAMALAGAPAIDAISADLIAKVP